MEIAQMSTEECQDALNTLRNHDCCIGEDQNNLYMSATVTETSPYTLTLDQNGDAYMIYPKDWVETWSEAGCPYDFER